MKRISDYAKSWKNDCTCVNRLLYEWHPRSFTLSEQELQQDLQKWLQLNLSDVPILVTEPPAVQIAGLPNVKFAFGILEDVNPVHGSEIGLAPEAGLVTSLPLKPYLSFLKSTNNFQSVRGSQRSTHWFF